MTLQVAMIGKDGWVLASDTAVFGNYQTKDTDEGRSAFLPVIKSVSKIVCCRDLRFIYAFFGDVDQVAVKAGRLLEERAGGRLESQHRRALLVRISDELASEADTDSGLLVIFWEPQAELWEVHVGREPLRITGLCTFGGYANLALYYLFRFYGHNNPLPVRDLKFLAACTILEGHECNPTVVEGLELWWSENGEVKQADADELESIRKRAAKFNRDMRRRLLVP